MTLDFSELRTVAKNVVQREITDVEGNQVFVPLLFTFTAAAIRNHSGAFSQSSKDSYSFTGGRSVAVFNRTRDELAGECFAK